jgi:hypothetical protein
MKKKNKTTATRKIVLTLSMFVFTALMLAPSSARADTLTLFLSSPVQYGPAGSTLTFDATVSAPSTNSAAIFLNADNFTLDSPLTLDDSDFFSFPLSLDPGDSYTGSLFTVTLPIGTPLGTYTGSFDILGGADGGASDDIASTDFQVTATPEPGSMVLLATGLGLLALVMYRKRQPSVCQASNRIVS